jgi:putative membrane protein insertion efficiency factor
VRRCRFFPSCSEYALQAFESKGFWKGLGFGLLRILKCHPWHPGGFDPVHCMTSSPAFIGGAAMHNISLDPPPALVGDDGN